MEEDPRIIEIRKLKQDTENKLNEITNMIKKKMNKVGDYKEGLVKMDESIIIKVPKPQKSETSEPLAETKPTLLEIKPVPVKKAPLKGIDIFNKLFELDKQLFNDFECDVLPPLKLFEKYKTDNGFVTILKKNISKIK